jgi:hypothetical protein
MANFGIKHEVWSGSGLKRKLSGVRQSLTMDTRWEDVD